MSSSEQQSQGSIFSASSPEAQRETQGGTKSSEQVSSAGEHMKHQTDSTKDQVLSHSSSTQTDHSPPDLGVDDAPSPENTDESVDDLLRQLPIPPASEPKQYRAIGLIYGKYVPSEEQFTRGNLMTDEGLAIDAVLLGRVMSLVKKHIDLEKSHLWVVYPRTRSRDHDLHAQIVGVWEPEKLNRGSDSTLESDEADAETPEVAESTNDLPNELSQPSDLESSDSLASDSAVLESDTSEEEKGSALTAPSSSPGASEEALQSSSLVSNLDHESADQNSLNGALAEAASVTAQFIASDETHDEEETSDHESEKMAPFFSGNHEALKDGYFSIRGEVVKAAPEDNEITVKIRQAPRKGSTQQRSFNLVLKGNLEGRLVGYFWDLNIQREGVDLVIQDGETIGIVLPKKRDKHSPAVRGRGGPRGRGGAPSGKRRFDSNRPPTRGDRPERPDSPRRQPIAKPQKIAGEKPQLNPKTD